MEADEVYIASNRVEQSRIKSNRVEKKGFSGKGRNLENQIKSKYISRNKMDNYSAI